MATYSITLDDVDLALLPLPSISNNRFLKKEMYEFQLMKTAEREAPLPIIYTCHLCAIEVPASFASEHSASKKHQANVRIASVAAERMRAFISALPPTHAAQTSARFCTHCSIETDKDHEETNEHRVAVMLDNLLWDLMTAYVKDHDMSSNGVTNNSKVIFEYEENDVNFKADMCNKNSNNMHSSNESNNYSNINDKEHGVNLKESYMCINNSNNVSDKALNDSQPTEPLEEKVEQDQSQIQDCETNSNSETSSDNNTDSVHVSTIRAKNNTVRDLTLHRDSKDYGEELHKFMNDTDIFEYKEIIKISIKSNDNIINNIDIDHYHSYERDCENGTLNCIVCDCVINDEDAEAHKYDLEHMRKVANLGKDGHYIREINELYSHCILCNLKIENINLVTHTQSATHSVKEYLYTNTRSGNLKQHGEMEVANDKHIENNEIEEPNDILEINQYKEAPNNEQDYNRDEGIYDIIEEYSVSEESSDISEKYDENQEFDMPIFQQNECGDPITYLQYLEQFNENDESVISSASSSMINIMLTTDDSLDEDSENQDPNTNLNKYLANPEPVLGRCNENHNLEAYNKGPEEIYTNECLKDIRHNCNTNKKTGDDLDNCSKSEEINDNLETYSNEEPNLHKHIIEEPDDLYKYSENEECKANLPTCKKIKLSNIPIDRESSPSRDVNSSEENNTPTTFLKYLEQFCNNEASNMSMHDDSYVFIPTNDNSSEDCSQDSNDEESGDSTRNKEIHDNVEDSNEDEELTNNITNITLYTDQIKANNPSQATNSAANTKVKKEHQTKKSKEEKTGHVKEKSKKINEKCYLIDSLKYEEELRKYIDNKECFKFIESFITVEIKSKTNILKTYSDRFHSYNRSSDKSTIECLVCDCTFDSKDDHDHKHDQEHIRKIARLGKDGHYIREVDETYSHCILCNLKIKNIDVTAHKEIFSHKFGIRLFTRATKKNIPDNTDTARDTAIQHSLQVNNEPIENNESNCDPQYVADNVETSQVNNTKPINTTSQGKDQKDINNTINDVKEIKKEIDDNIPNENNVKDYGDELRKLIDTKCDFEFSEKSNEIRIKMDNEIISILSDDFHSFDRAYYSRKLKCIVCDCIIKFEDAEEHKYDFNHMRRIIDFGNDQHYVRKINESFSHCILCNVKIKNENLDTHKRLLFHTIRKKLYTSSIAKNLEVTTPKTEKETSVHQDVKTTKPDKAIVNRVSHEKPNSSAAEANSKPIAKNEHLHAQRHSVDSIKKDRHTSNNDKNLKVTTSKRENEILDDQKAKTVKPGKEINDRVSHEKPNSNAAEVDVKPIAKTENPHTHMRSRDSIKKDRDTINNDKSLKVTTPQREHEIIDDKKTKTAKPGKAIDDQVSHKKHNVTASMSKQIDIIVGNKIEYPYEVTMSGNLRCVICDCQVPNVVRNKLEHLNGLRHRNMAWYRYA